MRSTFASPKLLRFPTQESTMSVGMLSRLREEFESKCIRILLKHDKSTIRKNPKRQLDRAHLDFLLKDETLHLWAGFSMKERVDLFHEQFPDKLISQTAMSNLYFKNGIRKKMVHIEKRRSPFQIAHFDEQR